MDLLEEVTEKVHDGYFVDLFVRVSNTSAITMYKKVCCISAKQYPCLRSSVRLVCARGCMPGRPLGGRWAASICTL